MLSSWLVASAGGHPSVALLREEAAAPTGRRCVVLVRARARARIRGRVRNRVRVGSGLGLGWFVVRRRSTWGVATGHVGRGHGPRYVRHAPGSPQAGYRATGRGTRRGWYAGYHLSCPAPRVRVQPAGGWHVQPPVRTVRRPRGRARVSSASYALIGDADARTPLAWSGSGLGLGLGLGSGLGLGLGFG